jgi:hypothetical protein
MKDSGAAVLAEDYCNRQVPAAAAGNAFLGRPNFQPQRS